MFHGHRFFFGTVWSQCCQVIFKMVHMDSMRCRVAGKFEKTGQHAAKVMNQNKLSLLLDKVLHTKRPWCPLSLLFSPSLFFLTRLFYTTVSASEMLRNTWGYMIITGIFSLQELVRKVLCSPPRVSTWPSAPWFLMIALVYPRMWAHRCVWTWV